MIRTLLRRWRYVPRRSVHLPKPDPMPAVDPWVHTSLTQQLPTYERTER